MPLNTYVLEQMVAVRLAEARAAARRDALVRAARRERQPRCRWRMALASGWKAIRSRRLASRLGGYPEIPAG
ncbi:MAG: hypothetical protein A2X52_05810 [Candidatus Rokubacteria bacterium GWC2_70_16]|nr:MAG: hypothetical protein A2X52_05810 [Candidatus Rokubacteria bacterium GWC2_70_16]